MKSTKFRITKLIGFSKKTKITMESKEKTAYYRISTFKEKDEEYNLAYGTMVVFHVKEPPI